MNIESIFIGIVLLCVGFILHKNTSSRRLRDARPVLVQSVTAPEQQVAEKATPSPSPKVEERTERFSIFGWKPLTPMVMGTLLAMLMLGIITLLVLYSSIIAENWFELSVIVTLAFGVVTLFKKGGVIANAITALVGSIIFLALLMAILYGPENVVPIWKKWQSDWTATTLSGTNRNSSAYPRSSNSSTANFILVNDNEWTVVRSSKNLCYRWWGENPDGDAFITELRGIDDTTWYTRSEWLRLKQMGQINYIAGWVRHKSTNGTAKVYQEFGSSPC